MTPIIIFSLFLLFVLLVSLVQTYNRLIKYKNGIEEAWSGIDVALQRRANLIPNLIRAVEGYSEHEANIVREKRENMGGSAGLSGRIEKETELSQSLRGILALAEAYPDLKASANFINLQNSLDETEEDIQKARNRYNSYVGRYNTLVESFPAKLIARKYGFEKRSYLVLDLATQREPAEIEFPAFRDSKND